MDFTNVQILSVEQKPTRNGSQRYIVKLGNGQQPSTFDLTAATMAQQLIGQLADVRVEQSGQFTNLVAAAPPGQLPPLAVPAGTPLAGLPPQQAPQAGQFPVAESYTNKRHPDETKSIVRQSSLATAFGFVGQLYAGAGPEAADEAKEAALALAREIAGIVNGQAAPLAPGTPVEEPVAPTAATPEDVQAQVNEAMQGAAVAVGASGPTW